MSESTDNLWRWIVGFLITAQFGLIGVVYHAFDLRITQCEQREASLAATDLEDKVQLATIAANQVLVMKKLDENASKLDDIIKTVYSALSPRGRVPQPLSR